MIITQAPSPNFGPRRGGDRISHLILHYTDVPTAFDALTLMQDPAHEASAHYLVDTDGAVTQLVGEEMRAWHAGKSWWEGEEDINSRSIGIEIQNPGHSCGYVPFPSAQIAAVTALCRDIIARHRILPYHVLGHSDIAPARKTDPGELFPWQTLAEAGVGLWPKPTDSDELDAEEMLHDRDDIKSLLWRYGYDARLELSVLLAAFQRHYYPEIFQVPEKAGLADVNTVSRLIALQRQKLALRPKLP